MKAENLKLKGNPVWIAFLLLPALSALIGTLNFTYNQGILSNTWNSLWSQHTLFLCYFFMPALIGTYCAYLWRMEHFNHNLNLFMTVPIPRIYLLFGKLITTAKMAFLSIAWIFLLFIVCGKIAHITEPLPIALIEWFFCGPFRMSCHMQPSIVPFHDHPFLFDSHWYLLVRRYSRTFIYHKRLCPILALCIIILRHARQQARYAN